MTYSSSTKTADHHLQYHKIEIFDNRSHYEPSSLKSVNSKNKTVNFKNHSHCKEINSRLPQNYCSIRLKDKLDKRNYNKHIKTHEKQIIKGKVNGYKHGPEIKDTQKKGISKKAEFATDFLFENQRGGILFGKPLFSSRALANFDPAPWTNIAQKPSATDVTNAQPPDPSWEWIEKDWTINPSKYSDDGWEYSFAFHGKFPWHKCKWWNSFVRRRMWIRKRIQNNEKYKYNNIHTFNSDYFIIYPARLSRKSPATSKIGKNSPMDNTLFDRQENEDESMKEGCTIDNLRVILRKTRIDREKIEIVEKFIKSGKRNLFYLENNMHDIMQLFIFQASRRSLVTVILNLLKDAFEQRQQPIKSSNNNTYDFTRLLEATLRTAIQESKRFEYWSEVKEMSQNGYYSVY